jgi:aminopeptidase N
MVLVGEEKFSMALGTYFKKFEWKNTRLDDFIDCIEQYFDSI